MKPHNFSAGPGILPADVLRQASEAINNFAGTGLSILEVSHRSPEIVNMMGHAEALVRELLDVSDDFAVLFLTGGASSQFFMTPANFLNPGDKAYYVNTGTWSTKAIQEAKIYGEIEVLASGEDLQFTGIPNLNRIPDDGRYLHITSNNTIYGTQYHQWPETTMPLVCDASSDIFSRTMPMDRFGCVYAGAQKNMGPAGTTLVIVRKDMIEGVDRGLPTMMKYSTHIAKKSSFNTPPVYAIYVSMLTMQWVKDQGGVEAMRAINQRKADLLYRAIDASPMFKNKVAHENRSVMNVTFVCDDEHVNDFLAVCRTEGISGIKGHRSTGGFRASIYNAMPYESVEHLVQVMNQFEQSR